MTGHNAAKLNAGPPYHGSRRVAGASDGASNSSSSCSATTSNPSTGRGAALTPDVPLGVGQVTVLQGRHRQLLGTVPVESVGGGVEVAFPALAVQLAAHEDGSGR